MQIDPLRYARVLVLGMFVMLVLMALANMAAGLDLPPGLSVILPAMFAAQGEGRAHIRAGRAPATGGPAWLAATAMTGIVLMFLLALLLIQLAVPGVISVLAGATTDILMQLYALILGIVLLVNRLFYGLGQLLEMKR